MGKKYYAAHSPNGLANGVHVLRFTDKAARDEWVEEHKDVGVHGASAVAYEDFKHLALHHSNCRMTNYEAE
jgi:hypothetical protein